MLSDWFCYVSGDACKFQHAETERSLQVEISDYAKQMTAARLSLENALGLVSATRTQDAQMLMSGMKCPLPCLPWLSSVQSLIAALSGNSQGTGFASEISSVRRRKNAPVGLCRS
jgi:hypothetical protein